MTTSPHEDNPDETLETAKLLLLSILDEYGPITVDSDRFVQMGRHQSWALEVAPTDQGRMSVSVIWR